jgi:uncharacterized protein
VEVERKLVDFLLNPDNYPEKSRAIVHHETHISQVFVGDSYVYKIKKPVNLGFLDFTDLEKRRHFCGEEVRLNGRLAEDVYIGVIPVYGQAGSYSFSKDVGSKVVEYAVKMRRVPEKRVLHNLIGEGRLLHGELEPVGLRLARFHDEVPVYRGGIYGGLGSVIATTEENYEEISPFIGVTLDQRLYDDLIDYTRGFLRQWKSLFGKRKKDGLVREGHGDLHSQHVVLNDPPIIYDCIEFSRRFRISDILEDIAFLLMDLDYRGRFDLSRALFKAYFSKQRHALISQLLRFYKVYRAIVRGKIEGLTSQGLANKEEQRKAIRRAREYYSLADHYVKNEGVHFNPVVFMGASGSGKSAIATRLLPEALVLHSDVVRKELLGLKSEEHNYVDYRTGIYADDITNKTYHSLTERAVEDARSGKRVIVDATYLKEEQRLAFFGACCAAGLNPFFVYCFAAENVLRKRVEQRRTERTDSSDAHPDILEQQLAFSEEPVELPFFRVLRLNTDEDLDTIRKAMRELLL